MILLRFIWLPNKKKGLIKSKSFHVYMATIIRDTRFSSVELLDLYCEIPDNLKRQCYQLSRDVPTRLAEPPES